MIFFSPKKTKLNVHIKKKNPKLEVKMSIQLSNFCSISPSHELKNNNNNKIFKGKI